MKFKTSMTALKRMSYDRIFKSGYCDLQDIMHGKDPLYYNTGVYGWNCDIYTAYIDGKSIAITTGYRNTRGTWIPSDLIKKYNKRMDDIMEHVAWSDPEIDDLRESVRKDFYRDLLKL